MKKFLILILTMVLVFLLVSDISATPNSDIEYSITDDPPYLNAWISVAGIDFLDSQVALQYHKNGETYAAAQFNRSSVYLQGSYLFNSGLFLGSNFQMDSIFNYLDLVPGYRYNFNKSNYIAFRLRFHEDFTYNYASIDYNTYGRYFDEKTKITGGLLYNRNGISFGGSINRLITTGLVVGGAFDSAISQEVSANVHGGLSFYNNNFVSNLSFYLPNLINHSTISIFPELNANAIGYFENIGLGIDYTITNGGQQWNQSYFFLGKYRLSDSSLIFKFRPANMAWVLSFEKTL